MPFWPKLACLTYYQERQSFPWPLVRIYICPIKGHDYPWRPGATWARNRSGWLPDRSDAHPCLKWRHSQRNRYRSDRPCRQLRFAQARRNGPVHSQNWKDWQSWEPGKGIIPRRRHFFGFLLQNDATYTWRYSKYKLIKRFWATYDRRKKVIPWN